MSAIQEKSNIAIILAVVISSSGYILGNSDDVITNDAIAEIKNDISEIKTDVKDLQNNYANHRAEDAHPAQKEKSYFFEKQIDQILERLHELETKWP